MKKINKALILSSFLAFFYLNINIAEAADSLSPVYALWNKSESCQYFTTSSSEKKTLASRSSWKDNGIPFYAYSNGQKDSVPVYRFKNTEDNYYFYTTSESAKKELLKSKNWSSRGIAFYAYDKEQASTVPIYVLKNSETNKYFYTASSKEKVDMLADKKWKDEGTVFWVPEKNTDVSEDSDTLKDESVSWTNYGPEIAVGLWNYSKNDLEDDYFEIDANKDYSIRDKDGKKIADVSKDKTTKVKYDGDKKLLVYNSISKIKLDKEVRFEAKDEKDLNIIFNAHRPDSSYDEYRGKIKLKYNDTDKNIWVINTLPMEQYAWGMGETTGTGPFEHTKVMTTIFRTYGYWYKENATKYLPYGFTLRSDSGSQIYRGYEWEEKYPNIKKAAEETRGVIVRYDNEVAITPYCSWSDGYTRRYEDGHWGGYKNISDYKEKESKVYPWLDSVKDPYGKHSSYSTKTLANSGNHMVGLIANGSVKLAGSSYKKTYDWILKYYYDDISLKKMY